MWYHSRNATTNIKSQVSSASDFKMPNMIDIRMFCFSLGWHKFRFASEYLFGDCLVYVSKTFVLKLVLPSPLVLNCCV